MVEAQDKQPRSLWGSWVAQSLWISIPVVLAISVLILLAANRWGVANDCAALGVTQDGQCGLATGMGDLLGFIGGGIFLVIGAGATLIARVRNLTGSSSGKGENGVA
jgi:hypothetical protein